MSTIEETIDAWGLPSNTAQRLKDWFTSRDNGYNLENAPDVGFFNLSDGELQEAGLHTRQQRKLVLAKLKPQQGEPLAHLQ